MAYELAPIINRMTWMLPRPLVENLTREDLYAVATSVRDGYIDEDEGIEALRLRAYVNIDNASAWKARV